MVPTPRLALVVALASVIVVVWPVTLVVIGALAVVVGIIDALAAPRPALVGVERTLPPVLTLGDGDAQVAWRITNPLRRRLTVAIADELAPSLGASRRRVRIRIPPGATITASATLRPTRRGRFEPSEVAVRVEGPLGLAARQGRRPLPGLLRVRPRSPSRRDAELRIQRARLDIGLRSARVRGSGTDFDSLREYGVDDDSRRIDWAATARALKPIVRTYRAERNQQVVLLLDNGRLMAGQVAGVPRVEWAMDAAMTLGAVCTGLGDRCGLVAFDRDIRSMVPPSSGPAQLGRIIDGLYDLEPQLVESDYHGAFAATVSRVRRRALLVLLTELADEALAETLLPALPLLLGRHLVIVASVVDPALPSWAEAAPDDARSAFRAAAAQTALDRRRRTAAHLRRLGATVVDASPAELPGVLADAYLRIKATAQL